MVTPEDLGQRGHPRARGSSGSTAARAARQLGQHGRPFGHPGLGPVASSASSTSSATPGPGPAWPRDRLGLLGHGGTRGTRRAPDTPQRLRASLPTPRPGPAQSPRAAPNGRQRTTQRPNGAHTEVPERGSAPAGCPSRVPSRVRPGSVQGAVQGTNIALTCTVQGVQGETPRKHPPRRLSAGVCPCPSEPRREHRPTTPEQWRQTMA